MAEVAAETSENTALDADEQPKRGRGRPPKPKADGKSEEPQELLDTLRGYPDEAWKTRLFMYLWRQYPIIDRKATGNDFNLRKYTQPIDMQDILEEFGSGIYKLQLNSYDPTTGHSDIIGTQIIRLMNEKYPPAIPHGEWVKDVRNKDWWWAEPALLAKKNEALKAANAGNETAQVVQAISEAIKQFRPEATSEEQKQLMTHVLDQLQASQDRVFEILSQKGGGIAELVPLVKLILDQRPATDGANPMLTHVLEELREERKFSRQLLEKLNTPHETKSFMEQVMEAKEIVSLFRGGSGRSESSGPDWAGIAKEFGSKILDVADGAFKAWLWAKGQPQPMNNRPATVHPQPGLPPAPGAPMTPQQQEDALRIMNQQFGPMFDACVPTLMEVFRDNAPGMEFREWFREEYGEFVYREIVKLDTRTIMALIDMRRQLAPPQIQRELADFNPTEKVQQFLEEFLSSKEWNPPEESEGQDLNSSNSAGGF